jgi:hypothetical protein
VNTLAELPSALAVITATSLIAVIVSGCIACRIIAIVAKAPDRTGLAACLKEIAGIIRAVRKSRP